MRKVSAVGRAELSEGRERGPCSDSGRGTIGEQGMGIVWNAVRVQGDARAQNAANVRQHRLERH